MMHLIVLVSLVVILLAYFKLADYYNIIDKPNKRSSHTVITLRGGGIVFPISIILWALFSNGAFNPFVIGLCLISLISFLDDCITLSNKLRVSIHIISVGLLLFQLGFSEYSLLVWFIGFVLIIGWVNAFNFMDGINGITVLYALSVLASCYYINMKFQFVDNSLLEYSAMGLSVFGFYNVRKNAKTFAGDIGSVSMAYILAFILVSLLIKSQNWHYVLLVSVYGIDTVVTIVQRLLRKENIFKAHRSHLYQYLVNEYKLPHVTVSVIYAVVQFILNLFLVLWIIPSNNSLLALMYLVIKGCTYLIIKLSLMKRLKISVVNNA